LLESVRTMLTIEYSSGTKKKDTIMRNATGIAYRKV
jgi:hypothetical protein